MQGQTILWNFILNLVIFPVVLFDAKFGSRFTKLKIKKKLNEE
jgi:hypothetical protein